MSRAAEPAIAVERTSGRPRLEVVGADAPAPGPGAPAAALPPPPLVAQAAVGPDAAAAPERRPWTADEATLAVTGGHNAGWTAGLTLSHNLRRELLEAAYAKPQELATAGDALARLLDHTPLEPGGAGPLGIISDVLVSAQAVIGLEVRHQGLVREAARRLEDRGGSGSAPRPAPGPVRPGPHMAPAPPPPPPPPPPSRAEAPPEPEPEEGAAFRFDRKALQVIAGASSPNPLTGATAPGRNLPA